jgi:hypothetical protein
MFLVQKDIVAIWNYSIKNLFLYLNKCYMILLTIKFYSVKISIIRRITPRFITVKITGEDLPRNYKTIIYEKLEKIKG